MIGTFAGVIMIAFATPDEDDQQTEMLDEMNQENFAGYSPSQKYLIGVISGLLGAFSISIVFVTTRSLKGIHFSIV